MVEFVSKGEVFFSETSNQFLRFPLSLLSYCRTSPSTESQTIFTVHWTRSYFVLGRAMKVFRVGRRKMVTRRKKVLRSAQRCLESAVGCKFLWLSRRFSSRHLHSFFIFEWFFNPAIFNLARNFAFVMWKLKIIKSAKAFAQLFNKEEVKTFFAINLFSNNNK